MLELRDLKVHFDISRRGTGKTIVTILADSGTRYISKLYNPAFLREKDLPVPQWMDGA